jgi:uncharacterized protein YndB with AHSA1/START domain
MAAIEESIEIARRPEDVFAYVIDFSHYPEWQGSVISAGWEGDASPALGAKATVIRRVGPRESASTEEMTQFEPPRSWAVRSDGGPVVGIARGSIEPLDGGERSRVTIALDFEGRGIRRLLLPLVVRPQARRQLPRNQRKLKELLEQ